MVTTKPFEWTRQKTLGVANHSCVACHGLGLAGGRLDAMQPCSCVLRAIFRECLTMFVSIATQPRSLDRAIGWSRCDENYMADFVAIAKRTLVDGDLHRVFRIHFLLGAAPEACIKKLGGDCGGFYHAVSQIEQQLGRAFAETQPFPLFPIAEYFGSGSQPVRIR
jgi:hypothetical protein